MLAERKRPHGRDNSRRFRLDEDCVLVVAESFQILVGANRAILVNVITDSTDLYLLIVNLQSLVVVRNSVTWKTDYALGIAQACIFRILEDDDVSSLQPRRHTRPHSVNSVRSAITVPPFLHNQMGARLNG